jgi:hypothetical protein
VVIYFSDSYLWLLVEGARDLPADGGISAELRDEVLNRELFFTLKEAGVVIEN